MTWWGTTSTPARVSVTPSRPMAHHHVSVLVAGTFMRYFTSSCTHLIAPMTEQGHSVDYYAVLTTGHARRWRPTTLDVTYDPRFGPADAGASRPSNARIEATVRRCVEAANGTLRIFLC
eukprot:scaffold34239_cov66-Phaeocystis_antarctica.AAC.7